MTKAESSQLIAVAITAVLLGFVVMRRMRPQPVRPDRLLVGFRAVLTGSPFGSKSVGTQHGLVYDLSADLLFLTLGLWVARAYFVYQRHRQHVAAAVD